MFCRLASDRGLGDCCKPSDADCISKPSHSICSTIYSFSPYKYFACPFESAACGNKIEYQLSSDYANTVIQSKPGFTRSKVCYFSISAPLEAKDGDLLYLKMLTVTSATIVVSMAVDMNELTPKISCNVTSNSVVIARHP